MAEPDPNAEGRFDVGRVVVMTCAIAAVVVAAFVIITCCVLVAKGWPLGDLKEIMIASVTFLFSQSILFVREFINGGKS